MPLHRVGVGCPVDADGLDVAVVVDDHVAVLPGDLGEALHRYISRSTADFLHFLLADEERALDQVARHLPPIPLRSEKQIVALDNEGTDMSPPTLEAVSVEWISPRGIPQSQRPRARGRYRTSCSRRRAPGD